MKLGKFKLLALATLVVLLTSCSDSDDPVASQPANDPAANPDPDTTPDPITTPEGDSEPSTPAGSELTDIPGFPAGGAGGDPEEPGDTTTALPGFPSTPDPDTDEPPTQTPTPSPAPAPTPMPTSSQLTDLFGQPLFVFKFDDEPALFAILAQFNNDNLAQDQDTGQFILVTNSAELAIDEVGDGSNFESNGFVQFACIFIDEAQLYYCAAGVNDDTALVNFLFTPIVNGESQGDFTFCDLNGQSVEQCINELVNNPDGPVVISVNPPAALATLTDEQTSIRSNVAETYMVYYEQGTSSGHSDSLDKRLFSIGDFQTVRRFVLDQQLVGNN